MVILLALILLVLGITLAVKGLMTNGPSGRSFCLIGAFIIFFVGMVWKLL